MVDVESCQKFTVSLRLFSTEFTEVRIPLTLHAPDGVPLSLAMPDKIQLFHRLFIPAR